MPHDKALKNHSAERQVFLSRLLVAACIMLVMIGILLARIGWLQIARNDYFTTRSKDNRMRVEVVQPVRGLIYDRNGNILAQNLPAYRLVVIPEQVDDMDAALDRLSQYIELRKSDRERLRERLATTPSFRAVPIRLKLSKREVARFEVNRYRFPGMEIRAGLTRYYPMGKFTAHVVGYVGSITGRELLRLDDQRYRGATRIGKTGIELNYESLLRGYPGSRIIEANAVGRTLRTLEYHPPQSGKSLYLTLSARLQKVAFRALGEHSGAVVALNPETGGVLAMVSKPSYNPNLFIGGISYKAYNRLLNNPRNPLYHRAIQGQYPPGSVVKPVMAIAALESGVIEPQKQVWCPGYITLEGSDHHFRGWARWGQGWVDMREAIYRSTDVYFYKMAIKMGIDTIHKFGAMFGLGQKTGIDLPGENSGIMPSRAWKHAHRGMPWFPGESLITVIGQGYMTATPLQLAHMTSLIAQRGEGYVPHLLKAVKLPDSGAIHTNEPQPLPPITLDNPHHWDVAIDGMRAVVNNPRGTAHSYIGMNLEYTLAGKSGTAQVTEIKQGVIAPDIEDMPYGLRPHAVFIAFAPIEDPQIAVAVIVEHGGGGSSVASPIARAVIDAYLLNKTPVRQARADTTS